MTFVGKMLNLIPVDHFMFTVRKPMMDMKNTKVDPQLESRRKAAKMLITIVIIFAISYFPVHLLNILRYVYHIWKLLDIA